MKRLLVACVALVSLTANYAYAETYNYTGLNFTEAGGVYTTAMSVTGSITTSSPIPPNSVDLDITPLITAWVFTDGVQTLSSANGDLLNQIVEVGPLSFTTDATGNITSANIIAHTTEPTTLGGTLNAILSFARESTDGGLKSYVCVAVNGDMCTDYTPSIDSGISRSIGTWAIVRSPSTPVPTMSVWGLGIFAALLGLIGFSRRRYI